MNGVKVTIEPGDFPTPFGLQYEAKGAYIQGKNVIVVGRLNPDSTIRLKYPKTHVQIESISIIDDIYNEAITRYPGTLKRLFEGTVLFEERLQRNKDIALMLWGSQTNPKDREPEWHIGRDLPYCDEDGYYQNIGAMNPITISLMQFHSDWNWIMEAASFIYSKVSPSSNIKHDLIQIIGRGHIDDAFLKISDFAKKYNESLKNEV